MENFIDKLNSTLNAANKLNESEAEETKDEITEDFEDDFITGNEEDIEDEVTKKNTILNQNKTEFKAIRPKRTTFFNGANSNDYDDDFEKEEENNQTITQDSDKKDDILSNMIPIGTLGATNHMHNRINSLEKYIIITFKFEKNIS